MGGSEFTVGIRSIVLDCPDPVGLASFYAELLTGGVSVADPEWSEVRVDGMPVKLAFQRVDTYRRPDWPDGVPQQLHLDLTVSDLEAASRHAVALGAEVLTGRVEEEGCVFIVHADPAGHPFCLCVERTGR
jgi:predicted enzyme related to lactoylglutathione lyase